MSDMSRQEVHVRKLCHVRCVCSDNWSKSDSATLIKNRTCFSHGSITCQEGTAACTMVTIPSSCHLLLIFSRERLELLMNLLNKTLSLIVRPPPPKPKSPWAGGVRGWSYACTYGGELGHSGGLAPMNPPTNYGGTIRIHIWQYIPIYPFVPSKCPIQVPF